MDDDEINDDEIDEDQLQDDLIAQQMIFGGEPVSGTTVESQDVWINAIDKTLDEEQAKKYKEVLESRDQFQRTAYVSQFIAQADQQLCFSMDQREKMITLVDTSYGEYLVELNSMNNTFFMEEEMEPDEDEADTDAFSASAKEILDERQYEIWKNDFEPQLTNEWGNGGFGFGGVGGGVFQP